MRELPYELILVNRKELPNFSPANPKFSLAIRAWQKVPLPITRVLGPADPAVSLRGLRRRADPEL